MKTRLFILMVSLLLLAISGCSLLPASNVPTAVAPRPSSSLPPASVATQPPAVAKPAATSDPKSPTLSPVEATIYAVATSQAAGRQADATTRLVLLFSRIRPQADGTFLARVPNTTSRDLSKVGMCIFSITENKVQLKIIPTSNTVLPAGKVDTKLVYTGLAEMNPTTCNLDLVWAGPDTDAENPNTEFQSISGKIKEITSTSIKLEGNDIPITIQSSKQLIGFGGQSLKAGDSINATVSYTWTVNPDPSVIIGKNKITGYNLVIAYDASWLVKEKQKGTAEIVTIYFDEQLKN
jgi:hypothetical protein